MASTSIYLFIHSFLVVCMITSTIVGIALSCSGCMGDEDEGRGRGMSRVENWTRYHLGGGYPSTVLATIVDYHDRCFFECEKHAWHSTPINYLTPRISNTQIQRNHIQIPLANVIFSSSAKRDRNAQSSRAHQTSNIKHQTYSIPKCHFHGA